MLQVTGTVALEKVLVPRGIALQSLFVGAAHEWRAAEKRSSPCQRQAHLAARQDGATHFKFAYVICGKATQRLSAQSSGQARSRLA